MNKNIGELVKRRRTENKVTLRDISEAAGLSIGYLSQLERGLTLAIHNTLEKAAKALEVEMTCFVEQPKTKEKAALRSYEQEILRIKRSSIIEYTMTSMADRGEMLPKPVEILPQEEVEESLSYSREGEEFACMLEGTLTLQIEDDVCDLYLGDCAHYKSIRTHSWSNQTSKVVKFIAINTPNLFQEAEEKL